MKINKYKKKYNRLDLYNQKVIIEKNLKYINKNIEEFKNKFIQSNEKLKIMILSYEYKKF